MPMINDITTLIAKGAEQKPIEHKQNLDAADFQKLFLEQMTHQDPLAPMEQKDMMAQLAQLMDLSRNNETNELLKSMQSMEQVRTRMDAASVMGKRVMADASSVQLENNQADISYSLPDDGEKASQLQVDVTRQGQLVQRFSWNMGAKMTDQERDEMRSMMTPGVHSVRWNGDALSGGKAPAGSYDVKVRAVNDLGTPISNATAAVEGTIERVGLHGDQMSFQLNVPGHVNPVTKKPESITVRPEQVYQMSKD